MKSFNHFDIMNKELEERLKEYKSKTFNPVEFGGFVDEEGLSVSALVEMGYVYAVDPYPAPLPFNPIGIGSYFKDEKSAKKYAKFVTECYNGYGKLVSEYDKANAFAHKFEVTIVRLMSDGDQEIIHTYKSRYEKQKTNDNDMNMSDVVGKILQEEPKGAELVQHFGSLLDQIPFQLGKEYTETVDHIADDFLKYEVKYLDIKAFNKDLANLKHDTNYHEQLRLVDRLLLQLEYETDEEAVIEFPVEIRPRIEVTSIFDRTTKGRIGKIFMEEEGMHMRYPYCNVYSERYPNKKLLKSENLLYSKVIISEVLRAIQSVIDPGCKNKELANAISECEIIENRIEDPLYAILSKHGVAALSLSSTDSCARYCECNVCGDVAVVYLTTDGKVMAVLTGGETVQITQTIGCYDWLVDSIKRAVNISKKKVSGSSKS